MSIPAVESPSGELVVLEGAEPVIDIVMPGMFETMLDISIDAMEAIVTDILTLLAVNVFDVRNHGEKAKRRGRVRKLLLEEDKEKKRISYTPLLVDSTRGIARESNVGSHCGTCWHQIRLGGLPPSARSHIPNSLTPSSTFHPKINKTRNSRPPPLKRQAYTVLGLTYTG